MGMLVHKGWTNVDLSWNQLWANLPKIFFSNFGKFGYAQF